MRSGVLTSRSSVRRGHDGELGAAGLAAAERLVHRGHRQRLDRGAEVLAQRLLAERALRPEVGHADRFLEAAAGRDDLAEDRAHFFAAEETIPA
jgi:hypothetical protein